MCKQRRIVCAALQAVDSDLLLGIRHYSSDMIKQINLRKDGHKFRGLRHEQQGFVDQRGVFLTRKEAFNVAKEANQIINYSVCINDELYSEGLY